MIFDRTEAEVHHARFGDNTPWIDMCGTLNTTIAHSYISLRLKYIVYCQQRLEYLHVACLHADLITTSQAQLGFCFANNPRMNYWSTIALCSISTALKALKLKGGRC